MRFVVACMVGAALVIGSGSFAGAQEAELSSRDREARSLYDAGRIAFDEGRFENALDYFKRAYELSQRPGLLFNIGTTADRLRRDAEALAAFQAYLAAVPDASNRAQVEARIAFLTRAVEQQQAQEQQAQGDTVAPPPTDGVPTPDATAAETVAVGEAPPADSGPPPVVSWALLGGGGGAVVAGAILLGIGQSHRNEIEGAEPGSSWSDFSQYDNADALTGAGVALLGVGIAAATVGLVLMLTSGDDDEPSASLVIGPGSILVRGTL